MTPLKRIIDSHVHLDHIYAADATRIQWMQDGNCIPISWSFAREVENVKDLNDYLKTQADFIRKMNSKGFKCYFLTGIHPRNITGDLSVQMVESLLSNHLNDPFCLGIGEIGLETGTPKEIEIFSCQIEMGKTLNKHIGVHTPRKNKKQITDITFSVLSDFSGIENQTVIDHCNTDTLGRVLSRGYWAGITLSPVKTSLNELKQMVQEYGGKQMMCNTDSGSVFYETLFDLCASAEFTPEIKQKLIFENACHFFSDLEGKVGSHIDL